NQSIESHGMSSDDSAVKNQQLHKRRKSDDNDGIVEKPSDSDDDSSSGGNSPPEVKKAKKSQANEAEASGSSHLKLSTKSAAVKTLPHEDVYLDRLPCSHYYERSYMHRAPVTHVGYSQQCGVLVTASSDGHLKLWAKQDPGIEFVKHFRAHLAPVCDLAVSWNGELCATAAADAKDRSLKVFDVGNFDMINMCRLDFYPHKLAWIFVSGDPVAALAVSDRDSAKICVFDGRGSREPLKVIEGSGHDSPVSALCYNVKLEVVVSADTDGIVEFWSGPKRSYEFPEHCLKWQYKTDTDLFACCQAKSYATFATTSSDGRLLVLLCSDAKIRIFNFFTGKLWKVIDESAQSYSELQQRKPILADMEFGKRMAVEKELDRSQENARFGNAVIDESNNFLIYATPIGVKVVNLVTNRVSRFLCQQENVRFVRLALCQSLPSANQFNSLSSGDAGLHRLELELAGNPLLKTPEPDPTLFCTGFKRNRFYLMSRREPDHSGSERDVLNEKPTKEEILAATEDFDHTRLANGGILHTTMGDIAFNLFPKECPKTVENFTVHSRNGYYNGLLFHRVIKGFMVQTGCPLGNGTGGQSIWGGEFQDEFCPSLRHDRPYTMSMANAGPNTNGSQFFITVAPTPWLDDKHTVFGRVKQGMDVLQRIASVKTNGKTDKPLEDIRIVSVTLK
ncbi:hypothetical protein BOX15_Mlig001891g2, partial [Macrostomum lignano]